MRNLDVTLRALLLAALPWLLGACATVSAPHEWLDPADRAGLDGYGGWAVIRTTGREIAGELIAVHADSVFVAGPRLQGVAVKEIASAALVNYSTTTLVPYAILGLLSTISHGYYLVFTAPMWLVGGPVLVNDRVHDPVIEYPEKPLEEFIPYARYPQGLPQGLDRSRIQSKTTRR